MKHRIIHIVILTVALVSYQLNAQDISRIGQGEALKVSGGLSFSQIFYGVSGIDSRRDPYTYFANGFLNFDIYGLSIPVSFNFSNQQFGFQQPFNQYGVNPSYEWITLHAGYSSMHFSSYTLAGHMFLGAGVEASPGDKWRVSAMAGRLQRAVKADTLGGERDGQAAFRRFGYGTKVGYSDSGHNIELMLFKSSDDPLSIGTLPDDVILSPEENMAWGINASTVLFKRISLNIEYGNSAVSRDIRQEATDRERFNLFPQRGLFTHRTSTEYFNAYKANVMYGGGFYTVGVAYERVDPGYRTHGAYFFNSDMENVTLTGGFNILEQKLNIGYNVGLQRNDLDRSELNNMTRWVGSVNTSYMASEKLQLSASYSNFQTYMVIQSDFDIINQVSPLDMIDTLNFTQISQNANVNANYILSQSKESRHGINVNISYQTAADLRGGERTDTGSQFYNGNIAYSGQWIEQGLNASLSLNMNRQLISMANTSTIGPVLNLSKMLMDKKLRTGFSTAYNTSLQNGEQQNQVINFRINGAYTFFDKHNVNLSTVILRRESTQSAVNRPFTEFTGTLTYNYSF